MKEPTVQEAVKEARKIVGKRDAAIAIYYSSAHGRIECRIDVYANLNLSPSGKTLRSCLAKLKKEATNGR